MPLHPQPGQVPGGGKKFNAQLTIIVAAVVAIALIIGGGVWYASSSGDKDGKKDDTANSSGGTGGTDDKDGSTGGSDTDPGGGTTGTSTTPVEKVPGNTASQVLFQVPAPEVGKDSTISTAGSWLTDKVYAKSGVAEIVGYDPDKGTKLWTIKLPGPVCQGSNHVTTDGRTAIIYQPEMPTKAEPSHGCSQVAAHRPRRPARSCGRRPPTPVTRRSASTTSPSARAPSPWAAPAAAPPSTSAPASSCGPRSRPTPATTPGTAAARSWSRCAGAARTTRPSCTSRPLSRSPGRSISEYKMATGISYASVVSTDPLVVAADVGDSAEDGSGISDFFSIDNKTGKLRTRIAAPSDQYAARCDGITKIEECHQIAVGNDRLYLPTEEHDGTGDFSQTNEIVALRPRHRQADRPAGRRRRRTTRSPRCAWTAPT